MPVQILGAVGGTVIAHLMFGEALLQASTHIRTGMGIWTGEIVATFALLTTILGCLSQRADALPYAVALVITAGYWFTSSTSFANPAVTIARSLTHSFSGIRPQDVPAFIAAQIVGAVVSTIFSRWLWIVNDQQIAAPANRIGSSLQLLANPKVVPVLSAETIIPPTVPSTDLPLSQST